MINRQFRMWFLFATLLACITAWLWMRWLAESYDRPYNRIEQGLYIGRSVNQPPRGTTAVVNLCGRADTYSVQTNLWEPMIQTGKIPTVESLLRVVEFIDEQRGAGQTVYVHCLAGQNRSGTVVAAYLMRKHGWSRDDAVAFLQQRRWQVQPNPLMMHLLDEWEVKMRGEQNIRQLSSESEPNAAPDEPSMYPFNDSDEKTIY